jgi:hypothetical protein
MTSLLGIRHLIETSSICLSFDTDKLRQLLANFVIVRPTHFPYSAAKSAMYDDGESIARTLGVLPLAADAPTEIGAKFAENFSLLQQSYKNHAVCAWDKRSTHFHLQLFDFFCKHLGHAMLGQINLAKGNAESFGDFVG